MNVLTDVKPEAGVYRIINTITKKRYIGSSKNLRKRVQDHQTKFKRLVQKNKDLNLVCQLHGSDSFVFEVIVYCDSKDEALDCEQFLLDYYNDNDEWSQLYNLAKESRTAKGVVCDDEHRKKVSKPVKATCVKTGETTEFSSAQEATRQWPSAHQGHISSCCSGERKTHFKHTWRYL